MLIGRPVAQQRFAVYAADAQSEPRLFEETPTLDAALAWVQTNQRDLRRLFLGSLRHGIPCYGEIFDWDQGCSVLCWRIG